MRFVVLPIEDARDIELKDLEYKRKNNLGDKILVHYELLEENYRERGMLVSPLDDEGGEPQMPELPYDIYDGEPLASLLETPEWNYSDEI